MDTARELPELRVILETSAIYQATSGDLMRHEVTELIRASSGHVDLTISWYLPEIVRNEREYQLRKLALKTFPSVQKLERILDQHTGMSEQLILKRVAERLDQQASELQLQILQITIEQADWAKIMMDAAFRRPPFSSGENEKGFRDALVAEATRQLIASSPSAAAECRIVVVTADELLAEAINVGAIGRENVIVLPSIAELKGFIDTLVSNVDENFIQQMKQAAAIFFFNSHERKGYIYNQDIKGRILRDYDENIYEVPEGADEVERGKTLISRPRFRQKIGNRMYWISRVAFRLKAYISNGYSSTAISPSASGFSGYSGYSTFGGYTPMGEDETSDIEISESLTPEALKPNLTYSVVRTPSREGYVSFDVAWSVEVTPQLTLVNPQVESIDFIEATWSPNLMDTLGFLRGTP